MKNEVDEFDAQLEKPNGRRKFLGNVATGSLSLLFGGWYCSNQGAYESTHVYDIDDEELITSDPYDIPQRDTVEYTTETRAEKIVMIDDVTVTYDILSEQGTTDVGSNELEQLWFEIKTIENGTGNPAVIACYLFFQLDRNVHELSDKFHSVIEKLSIVHQQNIELTDHIKAWILCKFMEATYGNSRWGKTQFFSHHTINDLHVFVEKNYDSIPLTVDGEPYAFMIPHAGYCVVDAMVPRQEHMLGQWYNPDLRSQHDVVRHAPKTAHEYYKPFMKNPDLRLHETLTWSTAARFCMVSFVHDSKEAIKIAGNLEVRLRKYFENEEMGIDTIDRLIKYVNKSEDKGNREQRRERLIDGFTDFCINSTYRDLSPECDPAVQQSGTKTFYMLNTVQWEHYLSYTGMEHINEYHMKEVGITLKEIGPKNKQRRIHEWAEEIYEELIEEYDYPDPERQGVAVVLHFLEQQYPTVQSFLKQDKQELKENIRTIMEMFLNKGDSRGLDIDRNVIYRSYYQALGMKPKYDNHYQSNKIFLNPGESSIRDGKGVPEFNDEDPDIPEGEKISGPEEYIELFKGPALKLQEELGIPAKITLAQAILESGSGSSPLAIRGKNHFGIKQYKDKRGSHYPYFRVHDDCCDKNRRTKKGKRCSKGEPFIKFPTVLEGYRFRAEALYGPGGRYHRVIQGRYTSLDHHNINKEHDDEDKKGPTSYEVAWQIAQRFKVGSTQWQCHMIKALGYATSPNYGQKLYGVIRSYKLERFDAY